MIDVNKKEWLLKLINSNDKLSAKERQVFVALINEIFDNIQSIEEKIDTVQKDISVLIDHSEFIFGDLRHEIKIKGD